MAPGADSEAERRVGAFAIYSKRNRSSEPVPVTDQVPFVLAGVQVHNMLGSASKRRRRPDSEPQAGSASDGDGLPVGEEEQSPPRAGKEAEASRAKRIRQ